MMSISNSSAFIRWSHKAHKSVEFSYIVYVNGEIAGGAWELNADHALIDRNLDPEGVYDVRFVVMLPYHGSADEISSEERQLRMLPRGMTANSFIL